MKSFAFLISFLIMGAFVYIFGMNNPDIVVTFIDKTISTNLFIYSLIAFMFGFAACKLAMLGFLFDSDAKFRKLKKHYEKTSNTADDGDLKIKTLENKIQTLEIALEKAMEK